MLLLSVSPQHHTLFSVSRVSSSSSLSSSSRLPLLPKLTSSIFSRSTARRFPCALTFASKVRSMAELVEDKEAGVAVVASGSGEGTEESKGLNRSHTFLDARTEEALLAGIREETEAGRLPPNVASGMEELYQNYRNAVFQSGNPRADEIILSNMTVALDRIFLDVEGHNIVLISNHQTEADPAVIALLLESTNPLIAENMIYVAGDRVVTDPLCKPFSMGRNLLCVYSKKHMNDVPELAEMKRRANTRSLKEMALLLRAGSQIIWIAPSGGRDRPDPLTKEWHPAPFDASSVDNMRRLAEHSGVPGHIYPLTLMCHDIMPPPLQVEKEIGEKRLISFHGTGLSVAPEIKFHEIAGSYENPDEAKEAYTQAFYNSVVEQYYVLNSAIHGKQGLGASTPTVSLSQPWN